MYRADILLAALYYSLAFDGTYGRLPTHIRLLGMRKRFHARFRFQSLARMPLPLVAPMMIGDLYMVRDYCLLRCRRLHRYR